MSSCMGSPVNQVAAVISGDRNASERHAARICRRIGIAAAQTTDLTGDLVRAQHGVHAPRLDGIDRHAGETRRARELRKCNAADLADRLYSEGAVGASAR